MEFEDLIDNIVDWFVFVFVFGLFIYFFFYNKIGLDWAATE